ncbi:MAG TPA: hypothetical protein EYP30_08615, partial [Archaeoglobaceae archaeon]|nr:hypothetical protein [Archaeoglobaceae archaeon]
KYNNPVPDEEVSFGTTAGYISPAINTTNNNGEAVALLYAPEEVGSATVTVFVVSNSSVSNSTTVEFIPEEYTDAYIYADPEAIPADGVSTTNITVKLLDDHGNLVPRSGVQVYLTTTNGTFENGKQSISGVTDNGTFTATLKSSTEPTIAIITANVAEVGEIDTTVTFLAPAEIVFGGLVVEPTEGVAPLTVNVSANVTNIGEVEGTYNATLVIDGAIVNYTTGTLNAGESTTVTFEHMFNKPGAYNVSVNELANKTVTVLTAYAKGDVDGDGSVLPSDALAVLRIYAGVDSPENYTGANPDVDGDGSILPSDALVILRIYAGVE